MSMGEGVSDLQKDVDTVSGFEGTVSSDHPSKGHAFDKLHDDIAATILGIAKLEYFYDVRMFQLACRFRLSFEALNSSILIGISRSEELDGEFLIRIDGCCLKHLTKMTLADFLFDDVFVC